MALLAESRSAEARSADARLGQLEDHEAIRALIAAYGPLADAGDAHGVAGLWCDDGEYAAAGYGVAKGRTAIAALIEGATHQALMAQGCAHVLTLPAITLSSDTAIAVNHSLVLRNTGEIYEIWRASANRWALEKHRSKWLVRRRDNHPLDCSAAARALLTLA